MQTFARGSWGNVQCRKSQQGGHFCQFYTDIFMDNLHITVSLMLIRHLLLPIHQITIESLAHEEPK